MITDQQIEKRPTFTGIALTSRSLVRTSLIRSFPGTNISQDTTNRNRMSFFGRAAREARRVVVLNKRARPGETQPPVLSTTFFFT